MVFVRRAAKIIGILLLLLVIAYAGMTVYLYSSAGRFPVKGDYPEARITSLIWPTIGYPAILAPGSLLEVEIRVSKNEEPVVPGEATAWRAYMKPSREALSGLSYTLEPVRAWRAPSSRWPSGTRHGSREDVLHVELMVPAEAPPELYDLHVKGEAGVTAVSDRQLHSVSVRDGTDGDFTFVSLADIHVHRRNISGWKMPQTDKGISQGGTPVFFENAIDQVNLIRPDFVVLLGDFVRAQHAPGDYQVEFREFLRTLERFEVPVFAVPGNHDLYFNEVDGARVWEENLGPLHYSFDVAGSHFTCVNTSDWPAESRMVMEKLGLFVYPRKWQGQVLSSDNEEDASTYGGQLAWLRDDMAAGQAAGPRFMLLHHDPFVPGGRGIAFDNEVFAGVFVLGGGGLGRDALRALASNYRINMVMSGHLHSDNVGVAPWADGSGETIYANQTCVYFDEGGVQEKYPGYRIVRVKDGTITSFAYAKGGRSFPFYDGSSLTGKTDLDALETPALSAVSAREGSGALTWTVSNYLAVPLELRGLIAVVDGVPAVGGESGGQVYQVVEVPDSPGRAVIYTRTVAGRGVPGASASEPGTPYQVTVEVPIEAPVGALR